MMTDSQKSFVKVKLWFTKLLNHSKTEQQEQIKQLQLDGILDVDQAKLLKNMLQADVATDLATSIQVSSEIITEASKQLSSIIGKQIGPYKIISPLGEGGMGQVYLAERNDGVFEQKVALKLPHSSFNTQMLERFENERQILAQLTHNNIAHLIDGGTADNNQPYIVMEYIQGKNIDQYCTENIPSLNERLKLILQICSAVTFSHQQLVLHRDLKPSNILVTESGQVKLLDFGIAKLLDLDEESKAKHTATQIMTRYYASPEQIQGKPASTHSDMFSLAIIAYELITGYHPFQHENQHEREQKLISGKIMRVTQRTDETQALLPELAKIPSGKLQGDLENILLKALSVDPLKRYETVKDFSDDLNNFIENKPVTARKLSILYIFSKFIQRHKVAFLAILMTVFTLIGTTIYSIKKANEAEKQRNIAVLEGKKSKKIADLLQGMFAKAQPTEGHDEVLAKDLLDQAVGKLKNELKDDPETKYHLLLVVFRSYATLGKILEMQAALQGVYENCIADLSEFNNNCQLVLIYNAYLQHRLGNDKMAVQIYQQAEDIAKKEVPINKKMYIKILRNAFGPLYNIGKPEIANLKTQKALEIHKSLPNPDLLIIAASLNDLTITSMQSKQFEIAKQSIDEILTIIKKLKLEDTSHMGDYFNLLGAFYSNLHEPEKSIIYRMKSINLYDKLFTAKTHEKGTYIFNLSKILFRAGHIDKAIIEFNKSITYYQDYGNVNEGNLIQTHINLALLYLTIGNVNLADQEMKIVYKIGLDKVSVNNFEQCQLKLILALSALNGENITDAIEKIDNYTPCIREATENNDELELYGYFINTKLAMKQGKKIKAKFLIETSKKLFKKYPKDYVALRQMFELMEKN